MIYVKNLPVWERVLRLGGGVGIAIYAADRLGGPMAWVLLACGGMLALSGVFGFCPACALLGRRLAKSVGQTRT